jgi:nicotinamide-nucleotide amidase
MWREDLLRDAADLLATCRTRGWRVATAESCTGGLLAALLTEIAGSSDVFERGFVTYSNAAKMQNLGVPADFLQRHGAVSEPVARAMAEGAIRVSGAQLAIAITGVAGPGGGSAEKPVGLVHVACAAAGRPTVHHECRFGPIGRGEIRLATVTEALAMMRAAATS